MLTPDVYDPTLNPLYRDVLAHYGVVALPCRVARSRSQGQGRAASATRSARRSRACASRRLEEAQALPRSLGGALGRHAHPRHDQAPGGRDVRRGAAAPAAAAARAVSLLPVRQRTVHLDGYVEVEAPTTPRRPGWIGTRGRACSGTASQVRLLDPQHRRSSCASIARQRRGPLCASTPRIGPPRTPPTTQQLARARRARRARRSGRSARQIHAATARPACAASSACSRCAKKHGAAAVDDACARRARARLPRPTASCAATSSAARAAPLTLRQIDPLIRELTHYRDLIAAPQPQEAPHEPHRDSTARCASSRSRGMAAHARDAACSQAQTEPLRAARLPLHARPRRAHPPRRSPARAPRQAGRASATPDKTLDTFDFDFNKKMNRALVFELATGRFVAQRRGRALPRPARHRQESSRPGDRPRRHPAGLRGRLPRGPRAARGARRRDARRHAQGLPRRACTTVPLLIIDDLGMRKLPPTAAEDLLELIMRRYERASTLLTSNRPVDDWGKLLGDTAAVTAHARPPAPPRPRPQVRTEELAHPARQSERSDG